MTDETVDLSFGKLSAEGYYTAKAVANWELGDSAWADTILSAYFNPADPENAEAIEAWKEAHS